MGVGTNRFEVALAFVPPLNAVAPFGLEFVLSTDPAIATNAALRIEKSTRVSPHCRQRYISNEIDTLRGIDCRILVILLKNPALFSGHPCFYSLAGQHLCEPMEFNAVFTRIVETGG
jgi:hypothetical protein